ncbi:hypothetical protein [Candidatus Albibeggiatoa sp. nov. BB20]|uniref:hypothetical protein n=1 Tax=Candidatus Albibeggiatoa sp. nov. BB20 TaxID=3162723 RepID=UPI00336543A9
MVLLSIEDRLEYFIKQDWCQRINPNEEFIITETESSGFAEIKCITKKTGFRLQKTNIHAKENHRQPIPYLKNEKMADSTIFLWDNNKIELHIIECKQTIKRSKWKGVKEQFESSLLNGLAVTKILGFSDIQFHFYTAYRTDYLTDLKIHEAKFDAQKNTNFVLTQEWLENKLRFEYLGMKNVAHYKIQLDENGYYQNIYKF